MKKHFLIIILIILLIIENNCGGGSKNEVLIPTPTPTPCEEQIKIELRWDTLADLDLHLTKPGGTTNSRSRDRSDCYFMDKERDWGIYGKATLEIDNNAGFGDTASGRNPNLPEIITLRNATPPTGEVYVITVVVFRSIHPVTLEEIPETNVDLKIYIKASGEEKSFSFPLTSKGSYKLVAGITFLNGTPAVCAVPEDFTYTPGFEAQQLPLDFKSKLYEGSGL